MKQQENWLLPIGMADLAAPESWHIEDLRQQILGLYRAKNYDLVHPSLVEYTESLLTASGADLALETCQFLDAANSQRMLGVRADLTPQIARIDARTADEGVRQYCYSNVVLRARPSLLQTSRTPLQTGVEIFGDASHEADFAVMDLAIESLQQLGLTALTIDLGHVGIYRALIGQCDFLAQNPDLQNQLFNIIQRKSTPDLQIFLSNTPNISPTLGQKLLTLITLHGNNIQDLLEIAKSHFADCDAKILEYLDVMAYLVQKLTEKYPQNLQIHIDLTELHGYRYQTGMVFGIYTAGQGREIARGGRYDDVGAVFGRARAATGFSFDLVEVARLAAR